MAIAQPTATGIVLIPTAGPPGVSIVGPAGPIGGAGARGGPGPVGPQGPAGAGTIKTRTASATVPAWCAVVASGNGLCAPAVLGSNPISPPQILGISASGGAVGSVVSIQSQGDMTGPAAGWAQGDTLYVGATGALTNVPPTSGWLVRAGTAASPTQIIILDLDPAWITPVISLSAVSAVTTQALTDVIASLSLTPPTAAGVLWRSQTFTALSPNIDGTPYTAPYGGGLGGAVDPITALLPVAVPRTLRTLSPTPPAAAGALWLNGVRVALTPSLDGTPYPTTPLPTSGSPLLVATRLALRTWLADVMPALPLLPPISSGALWRTQSHFALSL